MQKLPYIWDSWYRYDDGVFHVYYLNVDNHELVAPEQHHFAAKLGYATTRDFVHYNYANHSVLEADFDSFDDTSIWTGCIVEFEESKQKLLAFTSRNSAQKRVRTWEAQPFNQHLSFATANDDAHFERLQGVHVQADSRFYNVASTPNDVTIHAWRDPFIFRNPHDDYAYMLVTAQAKGLKSGLRDVRAGAHGVIALLKAGAPKRLSGWQSTGISFAVEVSEAEVPRLYYDTMANGGAGAHLLAYSCKNDAAYVGDKANIAYGFYGFHVDLNLLSIIATNKSADAPHLIHIPHATQIPLLGYGEDCLYACQVIPELSGKIMGFDTNAGNLRLSTVKSFPHLRPANLNFNDFTL